MINVGDIIIFVRKRRVYRSVVVWIPENNNNHVVMVPLPIERLDSCVSVDVVLVGRKTGHQDAESLSFLFDEARDDFPVKDLEQLIEDDVHGHVFFGTRYIDNASMESVIAAACESGMPDDFKRMISCDH